ncbi:MAG: recombinase family protein, partial [Bacteroidia bacterium]|nr:recombinase family protein [Bacteroidia bacterium]
MNTEVQAALNHKFGRKSKTTIKKVDSRMVIKYTRVSGKKQFDTNESIDNQNKAIEEFAKRFKLQIVAGFGATYESAKTDERKEFQRMIEFCKRSKGKISTILVYKMTRFSRTGGKAISIADELRSKYGIHIIAVTEPIDTSNSNGVLFQEMQLIFAKWDNVQRQQVTHAGLKSKYEQGEWCIPAPVGYDTVKINGERKIVLNEYGKKLRKAWEWKLEGYKNEEIIKMLEKIGVKTYKQRIYKIFKNPFYAGLIAHGILDGKVVEGKHEPMVSKEVFYKVNDIRLSSTKYGVPHKRENEGVPLKVFLKCADCNEPLTGYIVKKKNLYYYKCRKVGCKCNKSAKDMHKLFLEELGKYQVKESLIDAIIWKLEHDYNEANKDSSEKEIRFQKQLGELENGLVVLEEKFYVKEEMTREVFERLTSKLAGDREKMLAELTKVGVAISNLGGKLKQAVNFCLNLTSLWAQGGLNLREKLQKLVFPSGLAYDKNLGAFRTVKINSVIAEIARLSGSFGEEEKGLPPFLSWKSLFA